MYRYPDHHAPQNAEELAVFAAVCAAYNGFSDVASRWRSTRRAWKR